MGFLSKEVFKSEVRKLEAMFRYNATKAQMELYYEKLKDDFTDEKFIEVCSIIPLKERFFPTISVFFEHRPQFLSGGF